MPCETAYNVMLLNLFCSEISMIGAYVLSFQKAWL